MVARKRIVLHFPKRLVDRPIVYRLIKDYELEFNILKASVSLNSSSIYHPHFLQLMVLELSGEQTDYDKGVTYLAKTGVRIQSLSQNVIRNEERCTHCGACVTICPTGAFEVEPVTRQVKFYNEKCLACGLCIKACPPRAMELHF